MKKRQKVLLDFLLREKALREPQMKEIGNILDTEKSKNIIQILVKGGFIDGEKLAQLESKLYEFPYVNLAEALKDDTALKALPFKLVEQHFAVCFDKQERNLKVALAYAIDFDAREAIDFWANGLNYKIEYFICSINGYDDAVKKYGAFGKEVESVLMQVGEIDKAGVEGEVTAEKIEEVMKSAPVAQIVSMIVKHAIDSRASDIHIEPYAKGSRVRLRIDGILQTVLTLPEYIHDSVISRIKVLSSLKIDETRIPQDGRFKYEDGKVSFDFRVSIMPLSGKEKVTMRVLDTSSKALTLEQLGFSPAVRDIVDAALKQTYGMILVTGPTGSGKSTTLFSLLSAMNKEGVNISTLEDPVEYNMQGINQSQVRPEVKFTFASGLRALMRQDPDIIMVGEIRDSETAEMGVHAALTGHLLFSTLHTNSAIGSIPRLIDMKVEPFLLSSTLNLVIAQRLTRRICSKCKESYELPNEVSEKVKNELKDVDPKYIPKEIDLKGKLSGYRGRGCPVCKNSGYAGRLVICEAFPITDKMRLLIAEGFKQDKVQDELKRIGMINLMQDGVIKALQGLTTMEEVFRVSKEIDEQE